MTAGASLAPFGTPSRAWQLGMTLPDAHKCLQSHDACRYVRGARANPSDNWQEHHGTVSLFAAASSGWNGVYRIAT